MMPVTSVACQPRSFDAQHGAHLPGTHLSHEMLKPGSLNLSGSRTSEVFVDDLNGMKSQTACVIGQSVLTPLTLLVV